MIGLTGGIGSGKSTVGRMLVGRGAVVLEADRIVREIEAPGGPAYAAILSRFGPAVVGGDGAIDRVALAGAVFDDPAARADLERLTHPIVAQVLVERAEAEETRGAVVVLDIPLLAEAGRERFPLAGVIVVDCPEDLAVARLVEHRGMDEADARRRVATQASRPQRLAIADLVVDNSGAPADLGPQVDRAWAWVRSLQGRGHA